MKIQRGWRIDRDGRVGAAVIEWGNQTWTIIRFEFDSLDSGNLAVPMAMGLGAQPDLRVVNGFSRPRENGVLSVAGRRAPLSRRR